MFDAEVYRDRRRTLAERLDGGVAVFLGNPEAPMNYPDNHYPFRQDSSFLYYFGLDEPGLAAVVDADDSSVTLYGHEPTIDEIVWTGPLPTLADRAASVGVEAHRSIEHLGDDLASARSGDRAVHYLPQYRGLNKIALGSLLSISPSDVDAGSSEALARAVISQRSYKTDAEVAEVERAVEVSHAMHTLAMRASRPGRGEWEVVQEVKACAAGLGSPLAFPIIFSIRGEVLHNHSHDNRMSEGDLVVHDSGATSPLGYASDITRTIPVSGRFSDVQRVIYEIVLRAHEKALDAIGPGVSFRSLYDLASLTMLQGLAELGLVRGDLEEAVSRGAHALFFQCGCGHMVGLDVHDMEGLGEDLVGYDDTVQRSDLFGVQYLRLGKALEPRNVLCMEPGLYFIPDLIDMWRAKGKFSEYFDYDAIDRFRGFGGVRIEDDVVVLEEGSRVLGPAIPRSVEEVEATMAEGR